jgi:hypothetical protein
VFLQANGINIQNKHIKQILEKFHLEILQKKQLNIIFLTDLMFYVQDFPAKHFQLLKKEVGLRIQEEHCFLTWPKL